MRQDYHLPHPSSKWYNYWVQSSGGGVAALNLGQIAQAADTEAVPKPPQDVPNISCGRPRDRRPRGPNGANSRQRTVREAGTRRFRGLGHTNSQAWCQRKRAKARVKACFLNFGCGRVKS